MSRAAASVTNVDPLQIASLAIAAVSVVVAIVAVVLAHQANGKAERATRAAEESNQLTREANEVMRRQYARASDTAIVEWACSWDPTAGLLAVRHSGADEALAARVVVRGVHVDEQLVLDAPVRPGDLTEIALPGVAERREEARRRHVARPDEMRDRGGLAWPFMFREKVEVVVTWQTSAGSPGRFAEALALR
jgi:hypothetical protein